MQQTSDGLRVGSQTREEDKLAWHQLASLPFQMHIGDPQMDTIPEQMMDDQDWGFIDGEDVAIEDPILGYIGSASSTDGRGRQIVPFQ